MTDLIKGEFKKINITNHIKNIGIANIVIFGTLLVLTYTTRAFKIWNITSIFYVIDCLVRATFMIFSSMIGCKIIINELKYGSNTQIEEYERNIKTKIIIICIITFFSIILSDIILESSFCALNKMFNILPYVLNLNIIQTNIFSIVIYGVTSSLISIIPIYFGILGKSKCMTIIVSIILMIMFCSYDNGFSLNSIIIIPISFAILGIFAAYLSIRKIKFMDK
ncbi:MAG: hypothetical protein PWP67_2765 [Clostridium butyricum]|jgi:hypothetical protein|uniref:ABC transporter permease n=1 Tax=Clostridium butyricum TaxID=1492 RepID=A0A512TQ82_CLOBU|nr:hypothetical protein [Clostridium butyricum]ETI88593.1 MAG: hypothetical protein Q607_CBUC00196G0027 [Clostridium butyricum DORA_1]MDK2829932.1 hypothetical protein [Clostridium butyricum]MDU1509163.1 hypothetical protein [Clostridium butyricum]MDU4801747.1 hypothetical protein [Clostridium butyricum]MDU5720740.1 hypothetical protein [Clostridium butyricum]